VLIGADGDPPLAVLTDGTFMLTEGVPTLAALVALDTVTITELSLTTREVEVTVCVLVWWSFDTAIVVVNTTFEVLGCTEGALFGTVLRAFDAGPAGEVTVTTPVFGGAGTVAGTLVYGPKLVEVAGIKVTVLPPGQEAQLAVTICTRVATTVVNVYVCEVISLFGQVGTELGQPTVTMELIMEVTVVQGRGGGVEALAVMVVEGWTGDAVEPLGEIVVFADHDVDEQGLELGFDEDVFGHGLDEDEEVEQGVVEEEEELVQLVLDEVEEVEQGVLDEEEEEVVQGVLDEEELEQEVLDEEDVVHGVDDEEEVEHEVVEEEVEHGVVDDVEFRERTVQEVENRGVVEVEQLELDVVRVLM